jgi:UDP-2,3-diacylglucosamine pyrophosphatase LpxH
MNAPNISPSHAAARHGATSYRTVFISDTHLGTRGARADFLADFLRRVDCERLFLVGDIIDGWRLRKSWYWDEAHDEVRLLVMHGDEFDSVVRYAKFLAILGDGAYTAALFANRWFNMARRRLGYPYWSLSAWLKRQVKEAVKAIDRFEVAVAGEARRRGFDGVVCGHIHHAEMRDIGGVTYFNDGDWVESCTALVEHADGRLELIDWAALNRLSFFAPRSARLPATA